MHDDRTIVEGRIRRELMERLMPRLYSQTTPLTVEAWHAPAEPVTYDEAMSQAFAPFTIGEQWSRPWGTTWFRFTADVPGAWTGPQLEAVIDLGFHPDSAGFQSEGLVWTTTRRSDGSTVPTPLQGVHPRRTGVPLPEAPEGPLTIVVEAASNPAFPGFRPSALGSLDTAGEKPLYRLRTAQLAVRDDDMYGLLLDLEVLVDLMTSLPKDDPRRIRLLRTIEQAMNVAAADDPIDARAVLAPALALPARASAHRIIGVGHAHIDTAWLWPLRETVRKCTRTFASAVRLMDDDPDYRFVCSQAVQYAWMEEQHPELFERIAAKVAAGQFVPVGGMWVEADMNLPSGESIVRQMVHGQRYFEEKFGVRCTEVWIPDVFGYPASLPQIFAAGGASRFVTQKLSWNKQNRFPHNTFQWEGIDGTRVLTHFPPVDTYNATVIPHELVFAEKNFRDHGWSDWSLMPYGYGNGGGGPTREMLERAHRMTDLDGVPRVQLGTPAEFFEHVEQEIADGAPVPVWRGELYFEMHRGTLTSQTRTKVGNRLCERLLREAELWWTAASISPGTVPTHVADELGSLWREVLVQQFHDILPGSSIAWVHADAEAVHARVAARLEELIGDALAIVAPDGPAIANPATHARCEVIEIDDIADRPSVLGDGPVQELTDGKLAVLVDVAGSALVDLRARPCDDRVVTTEHSMTNGHVAVQWDLEGTITSIIDIARGRELLPDGRSIAFELATDQPVEYDAWDLESWTQGLGVPLVDASGLCAPALVELVETGPLLARLRVTRQFGVRGESALAATWTVRAGSARVDLDLDIDWHEHEQLLSVMVPLDVRADDATCDIQFGSVRRPTHPSSPWDAAKFEVCAHRYVDLSEPDFGVAVLNDGRYGHGLFDGGIRVSLLRAAKYPDPTADQGRHRVRLAILPHGHGLHQVVREAEAFNVPCRVVESGAAGASPTPGATPPAVLHVDHPGVQVSAIKRPDDGAVGELIVRLHEACGDRVQVSLRGAQPFTRAVRCNALEEPIEAVEVADGILALTLRPFELVTLRLA